MTELAKPPANSLPRLIRWLAAEHGDAPAVLTSNDRLSFAELNAFASEIAGAIRAAGLGCGARVGLLLGNGPDWLKICFGASMAGAVVVPLSTWSTRDELAFLLEDAKIELLFVASEFGSRDFGADISELAAAGQVIPRVILLGDAKHGFEAFGEFLTGTEPMGDLWPDQSGDDALILYTSGSTSTPKGVRLVHGHIVENGFHIGERQGLRMGDRVFLSAPLFWSYGGANALPAAFSHAAALVLCEKFEAAQALHLIAQQECTGIYTLPAMTSAMVRSPAFRSDLTKTLRTGVTIGGVEDFTLAVMKLGVTELCNVYGATETYGNCAVTAHDWPQSRRSSCQGAPLPGQQMRFRDRETGEILPDGEVGLVEVSGRISPGYTGASSALNDSVFTRDGYYCTGDVGCLDADGAFVFVGRDTEMIKRSGINVSPAEVEDVLRQLPSVGQCAVVGVPDTELGELLVAYVVADADDVVDLKEIDAHCRRRLSKYKLPDFVELCDALPLTATGKLQRKEVKAMAVESMAKRRACVL
jgi:fatty-acyl-CoA synthase